MTNYRKTFQNKIFPELNSKKHTHCHQPFDFLRNCGIAQNLSFAKAELGNFVRNDICEWLRKLLFFFRAKLMRKERKILRFVPQKLRKSFANGNHIWKKIFPSLSRCEAAVYLLILVLDVGSWRTSAGLKILEILNQSTYSHLFFFCKIIMD